MKQSLLGYMILDLAIAKAYAKCFTGGGFVWIARRTRLSGLLLLEHV